MAVTIETESEAQARLQTLVHSLCSTFSDLAVGRYGALAFAGNFGKDLKLATEYCTLADIFGKEVSLI